MKPISRHHVCPGLIFKPRVVARDAALCILLLGIAASASAQNVVPCAVAVAPVASPSSAIANAPTSSARASIGATVTASPMASAPTRVGVAVTAAPMPSAPENIVAAVPVAASNAGGVAAVPAAPAQSSPASGMATGSAAPAAAAAPAVAPTPEITIHGASVSATGVIINDDGEALTHPNMSLYQGQLAVLEQLQLQKQELQFEVERAQLADAAKPPAPKPVRKVVKPAKPVVPQPYLVNLTGVGDDRRARIVVPGYGAITVQPGDILPNNWLVVSIDDDGVVAQPSSGHRIQRIDYQSPAGNTQAASALASVELPTSSKQAPVSRHPSTEARHKTKRKTHLAAREKHPNVS